MTLRKRWMFSYVVDHDNGFAPNPARGLCTLAKCKYSKSGKRNIVEMAEVGDWIIGTGGSVGFAKGQSAGHGKLIYAMRIEDKIPLAAYCRKYAGKRIDADHEADGGDGRFALLSRHFYYFGRNALPIPQRFLDHPLEKKGPGYRRDFSESFIKEFTGWLDKSFDARVYGPPCNSERLANRRCAPKRKARERLTTPRCSPKPKRKSC